MSNRKCWKSLTSHYSRHSHRQIVCYFFSSLVDASWSHALSLSLNLLQKHSLPIGFSLLLRNFCLVFFWNFEMVFILCILKVNKQIQAIRVCLLEKFPWQHQQIYTSLNFIKRDAQNQILQNQKKICSVSSFSFVATINMFILFKLMYKYTANSAKCKLHDKISFVMVVKYNFIAVTCTYTMNIFRPIVFIVFTTLPAN